MWQGSTSGRVSAQKPEQKTRAPSRLSESSMGYIEQWKMWEQVYVVYLVCTPSEFEEARS